MENKRIDRTKLIAISTLLIMGISGILYLYFNNTAVTPNLKAVTVTAHRGDSEHAPDNTMSSLLGAIANKADYSELDVQETKDGVVVLTHDSNLKQNTGVNKNIWELTYADVEKLDVGRHFSPKFAGEKIPTLDSIIKAANKKIKLNIEIKVNGHQKHLAERVVKLIDDNHFVNQCVVSSFDYNSLQKVKKLDPKIKIGYIIFRGVKNVSSLNVDFFSVNSSIATPDLIEKIHNNHKAIYVWTVNNTEKMKKFINLGVDSIITDDSKKLTNLLQEKQYTGQNNPIIKTLKLIEGYIA